MELLRDSLDVYNAASFPIRRSRVLIRCIAFAYRDSGDDYAVNLGNVREMGSEVERLLTAQVWILFKPFTIDLIFQTLLL